MSSDPKKSLGYMLGEMNGQLEFLVLAEKARQDSDKALDDRVTSLEQFKFKLVFIVASVGALFGFLFSNLRDGVVWLKEVLT